MTGSWSSLWERLKLDKPARLERRAWVDACILCGQLDGAGGYRAERLCGPCDDDLKAREVPCLCREFNGVSATFAAYDYVFPVLNLHQAAKFQRDTAASVVLAQRFAEALVEVARDLDFLVPVPLARWRYVSRGFNQSTPLAMALGARSGRTVRTDFLVRTRSTVPQSLLPARARRRNLENAFAARYTMTGARVGLVDDVVTTGATLSAVSEALRTQGRVTEVIALVLATRPGGPTIE